MLIGGESAVVLEGWMEGLVYGAIGMRSETGWVLGWVLLSGLSELLGVVCGGYGVGLRSRPIYPLCCILV